uniref:C2H2-type domain-containing protein n=1 Tax=Trichogramma kaykai TaxID=54128 RepID=A0ABD2XDH5_9HYME
MDKSEKKSKEVVSADNLNEQNTAISDDKRYVCDTCEETFTQESSMINHRDTIHSDQKDFACDKCEKKFEFQSHLNRHQISVHNGRKDFACERCEKKFVKKNEFAYAPKIST